MEFDAYKQGWVVGFLIAYVIFATDILKTKKEGE
tara:strand:- start:1277 stop:1378 length:102 start_codon:yes stop_codon:yes gene_type:complete